MSIVDFLEARISEDEAAAQAATEGPWRYNPRKVWHQDSRKLAQARQGNPFVTGGEEFVGAGPDDGNNETTIGIAATGPEDDPESMANANHIARWDPVRALAECAAKRAILEQHKEWPVLVEREPRLEHDGDDLTSLTYRMTTEIAWLTQREYVNRFGTEPPTTPTVRALASVYADHPDYDPEWAL